MERDTVLDFAVARAMAQAYMEAEDAMSAVIAKEHAAQRALALKGLVREYAQCIAKGDVHGVDRVRGAMVALSKSIETHMYSTGPREVQVMRDAKGRFSRYLTGSQSTITPKLQEKRAKGEIAVMNQRNLQQGQKQLDEQIREGLNTVVDPADSATKAKREEAQARAGAVRAISRFQDELMDVFGEDNKDIVVVLETTPMSEGEVAEQRVINLDQPVQPNDLQLAMQQGAKMTAGLRPNADAQTAQRFQTYGALMNAGMRPDAAGALAQNAQESQGVQRALNAYGGRPLTGLEAKAKRGFDTANAFGSYFANSQQPQLQALGGALKGVAAVGGAINPETYQMAERANFRLRGMKDNLPEGYSTPSMHGKSGLQGVINSVYSDTSLDKDKWMGVRERMRNASDTSRYMVTRGDGTAEFDDPVMAAVSYNERTLSRNVSPRNYFDRVTRDIATASLIPEIPDDRRAAELGRLAGFGVPSSGIIIRSDGRAKEMYRGVGEDHYLPFSAKAIPEMRDGQYVRTRNTGGLTSEDISTIVTAGARSATVVSGSGVFTIELKPDVSLPGRLSSPEVAAMGERYSRILDQVADSQMYVKDLPREVNEELEQQAAQFAGGYDTEQYKTRLKTLKDQRRAQMSRLTKEEREQIEAKVREDAAAGNIGGRSDQQRAAITDDLVAEAISDAEEEKVRQISLNAEGYALAMETLRMQYPSIIRRVKHESLKDFVAEREMGGVIGQAALALRTNRRGKDTGYVKPGGTTANRREWTEQRNERQTAETLQRQAAATENVQQTPGGGTGAPAAAAATAAGPAGGANMQGFETLRRNYTSRLINDAEREANNALSTFSGIVPNMTITAGNPTAAATLTSAQDFRDGLSGTGTGVGVAANTNARRFGFALTDQGTRNAMSQSPEGITAAMTAAFGSAQYGDGWQGTFEDANGTDPAADPAVRQQMASTLDTLVSLNLMRNAKIGADAGGALGFSVPETMLQAMPSQIGTGEGEAVFNRLQQRMFDTADPASGGARRQAAANALVPLLTGGWNSQSVPAAANIGERVMHSQNGWQGMYGDKPDRPLAHVSVLGLLAIQDAANKDIEGLQLTDAQNPSSTATQLATAVDPDIFLDQTPAVFEARKKAAAKVYQELVGAEFLLRTVGGPVTTGPSGTTESEVSAGPKGSPAPSPLVAKSLPEPLSPEHLLEVLRKAAEPPPQRRSLQHPRLRRMPV